jgi:lipopolysaccharide export system protein LptA
MKSLTCLSALAAVMVLSAMPAAAQLATNSDAPVDITADSLEVVNASCQATWRGNAEALQDDARLRADVLRIFNQPGATKPGAMGPACGALQRLEADGSVYYATPQQRVRGDKAVYTADNTTIVMTGDVVAAQGQNVMRGSRMVINTRTGEGQMQGSTTGRNTNGRPRGVFYPNGDHGATSSPPTKPAAK